MHKLTLKHARKKYESITLHGIGRAPKIFPYEMYFINRMSQ